MAAIILPRRFYTQPQGRVDIARDSPFANGIATAITIQDGTPIDLNDRKRATTDNTSRAVASNGISAKCELGQVNIEWNRQRIVTSNGVGTGDFTMLVIADPVSFGDAQHAFVQKNDAAGSPFSQAAILFNATSGAGPSRNRVSFFTFSGSASGIVGVPIGGGFDGDMHVWSGIRRGVQHEVWQNSVLLGAWSLTVRNILQSTQRHVAVGSRGNGTTEGYNRNITLAAGWNRALDEAEMRDFAANPWQLFRADPVRIYSLPPVLTIPTLSSPGVTDITATAARPQVTLTY